MVPLVLVALLFVVQFGLAYYARTVLAGAAQDGAAAAARQDSSPAEGELLAQTLVEEAAGGLFGSHNATASSDGDTETLAMTGEVASVLPFFGTITVRATGHAHVERFRPQGGG
jgi:Flp pilus assembly protein TadG